MVRANKLKYDTMCDLETIQTSIDISTELHNEQMVEHFYVKSISTRIYRLQRIKRV